VTLQEIRFWKFVSLSRGTRSSACEGAFVER
jgi:hypothetical protein